ncbi:MAG: NADH-ubiquinone oxidoreductase-F iron-sulfur binding region domain-containing protein [Myxococcales bacterium]
MNRPTTSAETPLPGLVPAQKAAASPATERRVVVCAGTGCVANGAWKVFDAFHKVSVELGVKVHLEALPENESQPKPDAGYRLSKSGCQGFCQMGPLVTVQPDGILYAKVKPEDVPEIVRTTLQENRVVERLLYVEPVSGKSCRGPAEIPFYARQQRHVLHECGLVDPEDLAEYRRHGGYAAAQKAWTAMSPEAVCAEVAKSGLRGRGGGGFPTGRKWEAARSQPGTKKYVICNADEGDPGAFMNRSVMEGNPHSVVEGLMIAARAIGADETLVYVRTEYPLAVSRMRKAVEDAAKAGLLGDDVFGTGRSLRCEVMEGAGAFVCGEETAMIASIQGGRGMPMPKPPFPAQRGLWGCPTVINNVETLVHVVRILKEGADSFRASGTQTSPGTKTFALTGHVANTGLIEVPFGATLREVVVDIGGGVVDEQGRYAGDRFKAVQIGGPSGGCLTRDHLNLPLDFDSLKTVGAMVGSGGLVVMNEGTCAVQLAKYFMEFTGRESCGKCVLCREGTRQMLSLLDDVAEGRATERTLPLLEQLARAVQVGSLCGLGKTAPNPVLSTLRYFREEYLAHIAHKHCPAGKCKALKKPTIDAVKCKGCRVCIKKCPTNAITGEAQEGARDRRRQVHQLRRVRDRLQARRSHRGLSSKTSKDRQP